MKHRLRFWVLCKGRSDLLFGISRTGLTESRALAGYMFTGILTAAIYWDKLM
jgi:hypothetical protein